MELYSSEILSVIQHSRQCASWKSISHFPSVLFYFFKGVYEEIDNQRQTLEQCYAAQEFEKLSQLYTEDCAFMPPDQPTLRGREGKPIKIG